MNETEKLLDIMKALRDPKSGCPWDIEQNFNTIAPYTVEEAYEVADAVERGDMHDLKNELGDLLFQVVYHAQMANEQGLFDYNDVARAISDKLVRRHPHVFADKKYESHEQLHRDWEKHKRNERSNKKKNEEEHSELDGIAATLPALRWSEKLQKRASHAGFNWDNVWPVFDKLNEEVDELKEELEGDNDPHNIAHEVGDILFAVVNIAGHLKVNPEQAMRDANLRFIQRFKTMEGLIKQDNKAMHNCSLDELEQYWQRGKELLSSD